MNIKDIAKICGVSSSTVSKVLHNKDENISAETRKKVLSTIKEYHYVPYSKVMKNAASKMNMIAVFLDETYQRETLLYNIEQEAFGHGYNVIICHTSQEENRSKYLMMLENKGLNGIISLGVDERYLGRSKLPTVFVGNDMNFAGTALESYVCYDTQKTGYMATKYLLDQGHTNIFCVLKSADEAAKEGYLQAYSEGFLSPDQEWVCEWNEENLEQILLEGIRVEATAFICSDVASGQLIYKWIRRKGMEVPEHISVISIRDAEQADYMNPAMTTVRMPEAELAKQTIEVLLNIVENRKTGFECNEEITPEICVRNSVADPKKQKSGEKIVVVGDMNMDYNLIVDHIPTEGENLQIRNSIIFSGGKGGNQAVGARKLGGQVYMIGCLGNDNDGKEIYNSLIDAGVRMDGVTFYDSVATGKAYITIAADGESTIVFSPGANQNLDCHHVKQFEQIFDGARLCLLNAEISEETIIYTIKLCRQKGVQIVMKPSAINKMDQSILAQIDYLIPNEKEAKFLVPGDWSVEERAETLYRKGVKNVIVTLGAKGCYLKNGEYSGLFPAANFQAVDVTGASDAFISAAAVYLCEGYDMRQVIQFASFAAGISVTRFGVQQAMVDRSSLNTHIEIFPFDDEAESRE